MEYHAVFLVKVARPWEPTQLMRERILAQKADMIAYTDKEDDPMIKQWAIWLEWDSNHWAIPLCSKYNIWDEKWNEIVKKMRCGKRWLRTYS